MIIDPSAPGSDDITYQLINYLGPEGILHILHIYSESDQSAISWKSALMIPIPKCTDKFAYRPLSLLSCIGKAMEWAVLSWVCDKLLTRHPHFTDFNKRISTTVNIATLKSLVEEHMLYLKKASELADLRSVFHTHKSWDQRRIHSGILYSIRPDQFLWFYCIKSLVINNDNEMEYQ